MGVVLQEIPQTDMSNMSGAPVSGLLVEICSRDWQLASNPSPQVASTQGMSHGPHGRCAPNMPSFQQSSWLLICFEAFQLCGKRANLLSSGFPRARCGSVVQKNLRLSRTTAKGDFDRF